MQRNFIDFEKFDIRWKVGNADFMKSMQNVPPMEPFAEKVESFLAEVSKKLLADKEAKQYPDVITFAFWIRRASVEQLRMRFLSEENGEDVTKVKFGNREAETRDKTDNNRVKARAATDNKAETGTETDNDEAEAKFKTIHKAGSSVYRLGRGIVFHVAPSNVPVNYAYSLVTGLLCGNANVVRIPSKDFPQVSIINRAISEALECCEELKPYLALVQYGHDASVNDAFSAIADVRVIWGGDNTIHELRKSPLQPRATEITFADRYSLAVIDAETYLGMPDKKRVANDFYNDTYLTDQNACTSPRVVVWTGENIEEAKTQFWENLHERLVGNYEIQGEQAVNKLNSAYLAAVDRAGTKVESMPDNLIYRVKVDSLDADLMELKDNSGYFYEYDCKDIMELKDICDDTRCQTIAYIGEQNMFFPLLKSGVRGIDRIVPVGKSMDFDFVWDGYNLIERMTRLIAI